MRETNDRTIPVLWTRNDLTGVETCRLAGDAAGWRIEGAAVLASDGLACRLDYAVTCDRTWATLWAEVSGWVGDRGVDVRVTRHEDNTWDLNRSGCASVRGCVDVDLNFSPSTNLLPIRRLGLGIGESAAVTAAWLRFPTFELERLEQTYTRVGDRSYRYESGGGRFVADVAIDGDGMVVNYGTIWSRVVAA